jgi:hypothetical protein
MLWFPRLQDRGSAQVEADYASHSVVVVPCRVFVFMAERDAEFVIAVGLRVGDLQDDTDSNPRLAEGKRFGPEQVPSSPLDVKLAVRGDGCRIWPSEGGLPS